MIHIRVVRKPPNYLHALLPMALLTACAELPVPSAPPEEKPASEMIPAADKPARPNSAAQGRKMFTPVETLLAYQNHISRLSQADLNREYNAIPTAPDLDGTRELRFALLLSAPGAPFRDDRSARRLLQEWEKAQPAPVASDPQPAQSAHLRDFVRWWGATLQEQIRLQSALDASQAKAQDESKRAGLCQDKLDAIRDMEKSLLERDKR